MANVVCSDTNFIFCYTDAMIMRYEPGDWFGSWDNGWCSACSINMSCSMPCALRLFGDWYLLWWGWP